MSTRHGMPVRAVVMLAAACAVMGCSKSDEDADLVPPVGYIPKVVRPLIEAQGAKARFGLGWFPMESNADGAWRWMGKSGEIKITATAPASTIHVRLEGWAPNDLLPAAPTLRFLVDGKELDSFVSPPIRFVKEYDIQRSADASLETVFVIEASPTATPSGDTRALGFALVGFSWRAN